MIIEIQIEMLRLNSILNDDIKLHFMAKVSI